MNENLFSEIDHLSSLEEYLEFISEHFNIDLEETLAAIQTQELEKTEPITWEEVLVADGMGGIWKENLAEKKRPQDYPKGTFHLDHHFRGASCHKDIRIKMNDHSEGWTITDQVEGAIEKVKTLAEARKYKWSDSEIFKFQPDMGDKNVKTVAIKKADQPLAWMNVRNVIFPPGSVGATRFEPGVFLTVDQGLAYQGVQKPYFQEWFLTGQNFKGRLIFRLIPVRPEWKKKPKARLQWQTWMASSDTKGQLPYLLSPRGRSRKDVAPPEGESWLPPEWEKKIKTEYRWWPDSKSKAEKIKLIDQAFNDLIERGEIKARKLKLEEVKKSLLLKSKEKMTLEDFEYLLHHIEIGKSGEERIHHCFVYDHLGNMFSQGHLLVKNGKVYIDEREVKEGLFHFIVGLEADQEVAWSNEEAEEHKIKPKKMRSGMTLKEKAKEW